MLLSTTLAVVLSAVAPASDGAVNAPAYQNALQRCTMSKIKIPAGKTVTAPHKDCHRIARDQVAARDSQQMLASRDENPNQGRD